MCIIHTCVSVCALYTVVNVVDYTEAVFLGCECGYKCHYISRILSYAPQLDVGLYFTDLTEVN